MWMARESDLNLIFFVNLVIVKYLHYFILFLFVLPYITYKNIL